MDFRYLRAFILTARYRSFTKAGLELSIAQSAVSRQVRLLEESLSTQLLVRSSKKVLLTPAGESLYLRAEQFELWTQETFSAQKEVLRIGTLPGVLESWLIQKIALMDPLNLPNLKIEVGTQSSIPLDLEQGRFDLALTVRKIDSELVSSRRLFKEDFVLISKKKVDLKLLHQERWIFADSGSYLKKISRKTSTDFIQVNSISAMIKLVEKGQGVAVVATHMLPKKNSLSQQPLTKLSGAIHLCLPNYYLLPKHISHFISVLEN